MRGVNSSFQEKALLLEDQFCELGRAELGNREKLENMSVLGRGEGCNGHLSCWQSRACILKPSGRMRSRKECGARSLRALGCTECRAQLRKVCTVFLGH